METSSDAPIRQDEPAQPRRTGSRHVREIFESLPLSTQFRITAIAAVTVTLLAVQLVTALWDTWSARAEAVSFARRATTSMAQRLEDTGGGALDDLRDHPEFLAAALQLQSGAVLQQYVRGQEGSYGGNGTSAILDHALLRPSGWPYRFQSALAFTPIFVDRPVRAESHRQRHGPRRRRSHLDLGSRDTAGSNRHRSRCCSVAWWRCSPRTCCSGRSSNRWPSSRWPRARLRALPRRVAAAAMSCANSRRTSKASRTSWSITNVTCVRCVTPPGYKIIERTRETRGTPAAR